MNHNKLLLGFSFFFLLGRSLIPSDCTSLRSRTESFSSSIFDLTMGSLPTASECEGTIVASDEEFDDTSFCSELSELPERQSERSRSPSAPKPKRIAPRITAGSIRFSAAQLIRSVVPPKKFWHEKNVHLSKRWTVADEHLSDAMKKMHELKKKKMQQGDQLDVEEEPERLPGELHVLLEELGDMSQQQLVAAMKMMHDRKMEMKQLEEELTLEDLKKLQLY